jgi:hypothetical protein
VIVMAKKNLRTYKIKGGSGGAYEVRGRKRAEADAKHFIRAGATRVCIELVLPSGRTKQVKCLTKPKALGCGCGG